MQRRDFSSNPRYLRADVNHVVDSRQDYLRSKYCDLVYFGNAAPAPGHVLAINPAFD
jgi:hypothetical protein